MQTRDSIIHKFRNRIQAGERVKLRSAELEQLAECFAHELIELSQQGKDDEQTIQALAQGEIALLEEGYPRQSVSGQYLSTYRKAIEAAIASGEIPLTERNSYDKHWEKRDGSDEGVDREHYALKHLKYDQTTYKRLREQSTAHNNQRQDDLQVVPLQRYLDQVASLLEGGDSRHLAIAIAALTGRRITEVICKGHFEAADYPYALRFSGQQKKAEAVSFDILTLLPAQQVLEAIERFRGLRAIAPLVKEGAGHGDAPVTSLNGRINTQVRKLFEFTGIVPVPYGFKSVSIHRLRGIYGAIAIHYFCPEHRHEHRFLQHYLGHVIDGEVAPNSRATDHYFHYRLSRPDGTLIHARGVKIPANGLPPTRVSQPVQQSNGDQKLAAVEHPMDTPLEEFSIQDALATARDRGLQQLDIRTLLTWKRQRGINSKFWSLKDDYGISFDFEGDRWVDLWKGEQHTDNHQKQGTEPMDDIHTLQLSQMDLQRLSTLAQSHARAGDAQPLTALRALLDTLENQTAQEHSAAPDPNPIEALANQAATLNWLTQEVQSLRQENDRLRQQTQQSGGDPKELQQLREELRRLQQENKSLNEKCDRFEKARQALLGIQNDDGNGNGDGADDSSQSSTPTSQTNDTIQPKPKPKRKRRSGGAVERAKSIFDAISAWNQQHPDQACAVNASLLEREFGINRNAARTFETEYADEIEQLHNLSGVENASSHNRGLDFQAVKSFVEENV